MGKEFVDEIEDILGLNEEKNKSEEQEESKEETKVETKDEAKEEVKEEAKQESKNITLTPEQVEVNKEITKIDMEIEALEKASSVDTDGFYAELDTHLSDEEQQLEFDDKSAYLKLVAKKEKEYIQSHSKEEELQTKKSEKAELEKVYERQASIVEVSKKYPDYNHATVLDFFENKLNKEEQGKIFAGAKSYADVYENTYKKYIEANPTNIHQENNPNIPNINKARKQNVSTNELDDGLKSDDDLLQEALGL